MPRTRRVAIDGGFEQGGNSWFDSGSFETFGATGYVEFTLPFSMRLGGNGATAAVVTLWSGGVLSLGPATQAQIDFMDSGASPLPGPGAGFPGEFFVFDFEEGFEHDFYSFGIGYADYEEPYDLAEALSTAFFTFESGFQIILDENGFSIISEGNSATTINGYFIGALSSQTAGSEVEFDSYPEFFNYPGGAGADNLTGSEFADRFLPSLGADTIFGRGGNDLLLGGAGSDLLWGEDGNDTLDGGSGADTLRGGLGDDAYFVDSAGDVVVEGAGEGANDRIFAGVSYKLGTGVQVELLSTIDNLGKVAINLTGNELANVIQGNDGANVLDGKGGADILRGYGGNDTYHVDNAGDRVIEAVGGGSDTIITNVSYTLEAGQEVELLRTLGSGSTAAINLTGNASANTIQGNAAANQLNGQGGADVMRGYAGGDTYFVDHAGDTVIEAVGGGVDTVITRVSYTLSVGQEVELLRTLGSASTAAIDLTGNALVNTLQGNAAANKLNGMGGADVMRGYAGGDTYFIDNAGDQIIEAAGGGPDTAITNVSYALGAGQEVELLRTYGSATTAAVDLSGNAFANTIMGNAAANVLDGMAGADILRGYGGNDTFRFSTALGPGNVDTIVDFNPVNDTIALENAVFAGLPTGALAGGAFNTGAAATQADDRIIYNSATGALLFDVDGVGGAAAVLFATVSSGLGITASDFTVV